VKSASSITPSPVASSPVASSPVAHTVFDRTAFTVRRYALLFALITSLIAVLTAPVSVVAQSAVAIVDGLVTSPLLNINTADADTIATVLAGIGAVKAQAIVDYRDAQGGFVHIDELQDVPGIGEVTFARIKGLLTIEAGDVPLEAETAQVANQ